MEFNSVVFLFCFLPLCLLIYYLTPAKAKNAVLLLESLLFYAWGSAEFLPLILILVIVNYIGGLLMQRLILGARGRRVVLAVSVALTLGALIFFKYTNFLIGTINRIANLQIASLSFLNILPLGISYYTFKLISYSADVANGKIDAEHNLIDFAAYAVMFPQLKVGPIVKYRDISQALHAPKSRCTAQRAQDGAEMFVFGLAKKVILADSIGMLWSDVIDPVSGIGLANASTPLIWLGILAYSLQLYFDFAGYSEMSNGLSLMFGFECPANFNLPYVSKSATEFWRRWHITLSLWFRDYVYIPLGGNRHGLARQIFNMAVVWALTGIWHGANWNFICWGLYYFAVLTLEKAFLLKHLNKGRIWPHLYTLLVVIVGWGIFTANAPGVGVGPLMRGLFLPQGGVSVLYYLRNYGVLLIACALCSSTLPSKIWAWAKQHMPVRITLFAAAFISSVAFVVASTSSTALYANF